MKEKEYKSLFVPSELHYQIKVEALKRKVTIIKLLELWTKEKNSTKKILTSEK